MQEEKISEMVITAANAHIAKIVALPRGIEILLFFPCIIFYKKFIRLCMIPRILCLFAFKH
jgi:hypothetical protein